MSARRTSGGEQRVENIEGTRKQEREGLGFRVENIEGTRQQERASARARERESARSLSLALPEELRLLLYILHKTPL